MSESSRLRSERYPIYTATLCIAQGGGGGRRVSSEQDIPSEDMEAPESLKSSEPIWMGKTRSWGSILGILVRSWTVEFGVRASCWTPRDVAGVPPPLSASPLLDFGGGIVEDAQVGSSTDGPDQTVYNWYNWSVCSRCNCDFYARCAQSRGRVTRSQWTLIISAPTRFPGAVRLLPRAEAYVALIRRTLSIQYGIDVSG